ncbi:MAG TPA: class F sortase [Candidatus Saccharimonadales bacterium]|nr:class F sortase [Candidatus Saccharimonadales bacterium]
MALDILETKKRYIGRWIFFTIVLLVLVATGWYSYRWYTTGEVPPIPLPLVSANGAVDESEVTKAQVVEHTVPAINPRYISIQSLGIKNSRVFPVGVNQNNQLEDPGNLSDTAWYDQSAKPGSGGVILLNGHSGGITRDGVFSQLKTLQKGSEITIERGDGTLFTYVVVENQIMPINEVNKSGMKIMGESAEPGKEALNIITCDGLYIPQQKTFSHRVMLRAVLVN